jgi:hypothetical protein
VQVSDRPAWPARPPAPATPARHRSRWASGWLRANRRWRDECRPCQRCLGSFRAGPTIPGRHERGSRPRWACPRLGPCAKDLPLDRTARRERCAATWDRSPARRGRVPAPSFRDRSAPRPRFAARSRKAAYQHGRAEHWPTRARLAPTTARSLGPAPEPFRARPRPCPPGPGSRRCAPR